MISVRAEPGIVAPPSRAQIAALHLPEVQRPEARLFQRNHDLLIAIKEEDSSHLFVLHGPTPSHAHRRVNRQRQVGADAEHHLGHRLHQHAQQARIVLVIQTRRDYFAFDGLPHLQGGIIEDQENAILT